MAARSSRRRGISDTRSNNAPARPALAADMTTRVSRWLVLAALAAVPLPAAAQARKYQSKAVDTAAPTAADIPLSVGAFRFWKGATVASGNVRDPAQCGVTGPCFSWPLQVAPGGKRLRVALDTPMRSDTFELDVIDPAGKATTVRNSNAFDAEAYVDDPAPGTWTIRVMPQG